MPIRHVTVLTPLLFKQPQLPKLPSTCCRWPLLCLLNQRRLSQEPWIKERERSFQQQSKDIYIDSLQATLEAHRATNRAKLIRKVVAPPDRFIKHLKLSDQRNALKAKTKASDNEKIDARRLENNVDAEYRSEIGLQEKHDYERETVLNPDGQIMPWDYWPLGSAQYNGLYGSKTKAEPGDTLEYIAAGIKPSGPWRILGPEGALYSQRPWLNYLGKTEEDPSLQ